MTPRQGQQIRELPSILEHRERARERNDGERASARDLPVEREVGLSTIKIEEGLSICDGGRREARR
jgi:hypothetical protein